MTVEPPACPRSRLPSMRRSPIEREDDIPSDDNTPGRFLIEELIEVGRGETQVFDSVDRGLDSQTRLGVVGDTERLGR